MSWTGQRELELDSMVYGGRAGLSWEGRRRNRDDQTVAPNVNEATVSEIRLGLSGWGCRPAPCAARFNLALIWRSCFDFFLAPFFPCVVFRGAECACVLSLFQAPRRPTCNKLIKPHLHDIVNGNEQKLELQRMLTTHTSCAGLGETRQQQNPKRKGLGKKRVAGGVHGCDISPTYPPISRPKLATIDHMLWAAVIRTSTP